MNTDFDQIVLDIANRPVTGSWDRIRRYCGLSWSGGEPETWAFAYYDAITTDPDTFGPIDVVVTSALHPGLSRTDLAAFVDRRCDIDAWLADVASDTHLVGRAPATLERLHDLRTFDDRISLTLLSKVLHRKRPNAVPLVDGEVLDAYRPVTGERTATAAWDPLVDAIADDLDRNTGPLDAMATQVTSELGVTLTPLRALDIAIWTRSTR